MLLQRLAVLDAFQRKPGWFYLGADFDERLTDVLTLAAQLRLHRRVEVVPLSDLYTSWVQDDLVPRPFVVVVRNVLHELDIEATAILIEALSGHLQSDDTIIVQDLQVFPRAERGNACWQPQILRETLEQCTFHMALVEEETARGNRWFTMTGRKVGAAKPARPVRELILDGRRRQYELWRKADALIADDADHRLHQIALVDLDLQLAALQRQLIQAGSSDVSPPAPREEADVAKKAFLAQLGSFNPESIPRSIVPLDRIAHFRNRAKSQDALEQFLLADDRLTVVRGGPLAGKSVLVAEVLARRAHDRQPVLLDAQSTSSVWNLLEQYLTGIGAQFSYQLIQGFRNLSLEDVRKVLSSLIERCGRHTVVVFDHFERLLDPSGQVADKEVRDFITDLASSLDAKVILTTRADPDLSFLPSEVTVDYKQPPVGRFPQGKHVENVLDDFVSREALAIAEYPQPLIEAIDRHPFLTVLAARVIQSEGPTSLDDPVFLDLLRRRMREDLLRRISTDEARPAVECLGKLRIPVPRSMFEGLTGKESVEEALRLGLLYPVFDRSYQDLLTGLAVLRGAPTDVPDLAGSDDEVAYDEDEHKRIANWYARLYRDGGDPRWLRELHYHTLVTGDPSGLTRFGTAHRHEIFAAGEYWFRRAKDFENALWAFQTARDLGLVTYTSEMRLASCLVRVQQLEPGITKYEELIGDFPKARGVKTSYIDSLLYVQDFERALQKLNEFGFSIGDDPWTDHEFGRTYLGLHHYRDAVRAFESQLKQAPEPIVYYRLAQAYHRCGERDNVARVLEAGLKRYPENRALSVSHAAHLIRSAEPHQRTRAEEILRDLYARFPFDGAVFQQLCKLLGLTERAKDALELIRSREGQIRPERYLVPTRAEALIAVGRFRGAVLELRNVPSNNEHLVGLKKKAYLWWARSISDSNTRAAIARGGLSVEFARQLRNNIPIMVTTARLAALAGDGAEYDSAIAQLRSLSPGVAESLIGDNEELAYWEQETFD